VLIRWVSSLCAELKSGWRFVRLNVDVDMGLRFVDRVAESGILIVKFIPAGARTKNGFPLRPRVLALRMKVNFEMR
jgi:hypothetical protein